ncbi:MAG: 50S ribosomal protein L23 [Alphaproteobacteria bacterium]|nr:50S ribosomal protein L23 [Alphaproteobacteria bacterium]
MISANKYDLIRKPLITEKSTVLGEIGKYVFEVERTTEKGLIKKAIEEIFTVKVKSVNILNQKGKKKRFKGIMGRRSDVKKAMVTLEKDYTIDFTGGGK